MFKMCQYVTNNDKVYVVMNLVNVKYVQASIQKTITWMKKSRKGSKYQGHN